MKRRVHVAALVYQCGLANVFVKRSKARDAKWERVIQHAFGPCEDVARGLRIADVDLYVFHCDVCGDVNNGQPWEAGEGEMFQTAKNPPKV